MQKKDVSPLMQVASSEPKEVSRGEGEGREGGEWGVGSTRRLR